MDARTESPMPWIKRAEKLNKHTIKKMGSAVTTPVVTINLKTIPSDKEKYLLLEAVMTTLVSHKLSIKFYDTYKVDKRLSEILCLDYQASFIDIAVEKTPLTPEEFKILEATLIQFARFKLHKKYGNINPMMADLKTVVEKQSQVLGELVRSEAKPHQTYKLMMAEVATIYATILKSSV